MSQSDLQYFLVDLCTLFKLVSAEKILRLNIMILQLSLQKQFQRNFSNLFCASPTPIASQEAKICVPSSLHSGQWQEKYHRQNSLKINLMDLHPLIF